jgi:pimeloyl-ACP methyl ester carboxylesterase
MNVDPFEGVHRATVNGVSLAYQEHGAGTPVVFVHGSVSDLRTWKHQLPAMRGRYRAIAYSRRYARPNEDIDDGVDDQMLPHVEDLVAFLRSLEIDRAHLVGHSWGGFITLLTAIRHPDLVHSLVLMEPPVLTLFMSNRPGPGELLRLCFKRPITTIATVRFGVTAVAPAQKAFRRGDNESALRAFGCGVLGKPAFEKLSEARLQQVRDNIKAERAKTLGEGFPPLSENDVRAMRAPSLLLVGERSPLFLRRLSSSLLELLPKSERVEIARASHIMHEDNPDLVNQTILDFLRRQS